MTILVVVESPAKCRKIEEYLGSGYRVMACFGHVRDLPQRSMGVDFQNERVIPHYVESDRAKEVLIRLRREAARSERIILASDPDREGEAIAWHLTEVLGAHRYERATFHSITKEAVRNAIGHPRSVNIDLVNAQQARRILDRVVGFIVSPTCAAGAGMPEARSAGRVQSVALRLVAEREREIQAFKPVTYFVPVATVEVEGKPPSFDVSLIQWKGEALGQRLNDILLADKTVEWCRRQLWQIVRSEKKEQSIVPPPPFITATLQQAASVQLKISPAECMKLAQELFDHGAITYMRTDSVALSLEAIDMARSYIDAHWSVLYRREKPRIYTAHNQHAQEAHEAIRPTHAESGPAAFGCDQRGRLYQLIWERFIASQMTDGSDSIVIIDVGVAPSSFLHATKGLVPMGIFQAKGVTMLFDGWRILTNDTAEELLPQEPDEEMKGVNRLPHVIGTETAILRQLGIKRKTTKSPPRYTEAGLIKILEHRGVGRPSTYASIMSVILSRGYVSVHQRKLQATVVGLSLSSFLERGYTGNFIEPEFTSRVEADLDRIAQGSLAWQPFVASMSRTVLELAQKVGLRYNPLVGEEPSWKSPMHSEAPGQRPTSRIPSSSPPKRKKPSTNKKKSRKSPPRNPPPPTYPPQT